MSKTDTPVTLEIQGFRGGFSGTWDKRQPNPLLYNSNVLYIVLCCLTYKQYIIHININYEYIGKGFLHSKILSTYHMPCFMLYLICSGKAKIVFMLPS